MGKMFWGTGSAEGLPNPVCGCLACERARKLKGENIRSRSSFQVSKDILLDFGPDFVSQAQKNGGDLMELRHVLVTHTHYDHFSSFALCQFAGSLYYQQSRLRFILQKRPTRWQIIFVRIKCFYTTGFKKLWKVEQSGLNN